MGAHEKSGGGFFPLRFGMSIRICINYIFLPVFLLEVAFLGAAFLVSFFSSFNLLNVQSEL